MTAIKYHYYNHNYPLLGAIFRFQLLTLYLLLKMSSCYVYHEFSSSLPGFPTNPYYPSPHTVRIAYVPLCIPSGEVSKRQLKTFPFIDRLLSTHYSVLTNAPNNSYNPSIMPILCSFNPFVCAADSSCFFTVSWLWYWVADWYKCCDWRCFVYKRNCKNLGLLWCRHRLGS